MKPTKVSIFTKENPRAVRFENIKPGTYFLNSLENLCLKTYTGLMNLNTNSHLSYDPDDFVDIVKILEDVKIVEE